MYLYGIIVREFESEAVDLIQVYGVFVDDAQIH
jgi:hypothetical protein